MIEYTKDRPLRVFESFAGYGSQSMALQRLKDVYPDFSFEVVGFSEIDEYAIKAYHAVHGEHIKNYGDISKISWEEVPDFDLFTASSPCQDISASGKQAGLEEGSGTRSSLLWECKRAIRIKRPRYVFFENVKALTSAKFLPSLHKWQAWLDGQGYEIFTQVLNASDYGVPQNRERVFMISILRTEAEPHPRYYFPKPMKLETRIKDVLELDVDESYYLSERALRSFCRTSECKSHNHNFLPKSGDDVAFTVRCASGSRVDDNFLKEEVSSEWTAKDVEPMLQCKDGSSPTLTATYWRCSAANMAGMGHFPRQGVMVEGEYGRNENEEDMETGKIMQIGNTAQSTADNPQAGRVYDIEGISPTLRTKSGGGAEPQIPVQKRTEQGKQERELHKGDVGVKWQTGNKQWEMRDDGIANTLTSVLKDNMLAEPAFHVDGNCIVDRHGRIYRIRKLTERECFRLQDVSEADINKIQATGISRTQQYKMAGNSIVVSCMYHLFRKVFVDKSNESRQQSLF